MGCGASVPKAGQQRPIVWEESTENPLDSILPHKALAELPTWVRDLHSSMPSWLSQPPVRLLKVSKLLSWQQLKSYEDILIATGCLELPYSEISDELWSQIVVVSWRWGAGKPASRQGFSPMSEVQFQQLRRLINGVKDQGIQYVWIDWPCMPQYGSGQSAMVEIMRSKMFYARARAMVVVPSYDAVPDDGVTRFVLSKAAGLLQDSSKTPERGLAAEALNNILHRGFVANGSYFCRIWTLVERMARHGRPELLCHWLSLEAWLGMVLDAMRHAGAAAAAAAGSAGGAAAAAADRSAGGGLHDDSSVPRVFKEILGEEAGKLIDSICVPWSAAVKTGSIHLAAGLDTKLAQLMEIATHTWKTGTAMGGEPTKSWLTAYLEDAHQSRYQASSTADRIWAVYSYFCWKHLDHQEPRQVVEALQDLGQVAGASRVVTLRLAAKLDLGKFVPVDDRDEKLFRFAEAGDLEQVNSCIQMGANVLMAKASQDGATPLFVACQKGHLEVAKALVAAGALLDAQKSVCGEGLARRMETEDRVYGRSLRAMFRRLSTAAERRRGADLPKSWSLLALIKSFPSNLTRFACACAGGKTSPTGTGPASGCNAPRDQTGCAPLHTAAMNGHTEIVKYLLEAGAKQDVAFTDGATPLYVAAEKGKLDALKLLIDVGADKNVALKKDGHTPLCIAVLNHHTECVGLLIKSGADINLALRDGATPLYLSAEKGFLDCMDLLLAAKANSELGMESGATPLYIGAQNNHPECIKALLKAGANKNAARKDRATPLYIASERGHLDVIKLLLEAGANVESTFQSGATPIYVAAQNNRAEVVKVLIDNHALKTVRLRGGYTPIHSAALAGHVDVIKVLVEAGVDKDLPLDDGATPIYLAAEKGHIEAVRYLLSVGADRNKADVRGTRPVDVAKRGTAELLREKPAPST